MKKIRVFTISTIVIAGVEDNWLRMRGQFRLRHYQHDLVEKHLFTCELASLAQGMFVLFHAFVAGNMSDSARPDHRDF